MRNYTALGLIFAALTAQAQTTTYSQIQHVHTSMNHLTELDLGEQIQSFALADQDAFSVQQDGTRVFVKPIHEEKSTNLFIFTPTRQVNLELDPAGDVARMDVVLNFAQPNGARTSSGAAATASTEPSAEEIQKIAQLVLTKTMLGTETITQDDPKLANNRIGVELQQIYRAKDATYIRYSISNKTGHPFRITTPDVTALTPTQVSVSLISLRDHQLRSSVADNFKPKQASSLAIVSAEETGKDLAPGQTLTGVVSVKWAQSNPAQLIRFYFGSDTSNPVSVEAVI